MSKKRTLKLTKIPITAMMQILADLFEDGVDLFPNSNNTIRKEALSALVTLGINKNAAEKSIDKILKIEGSELSLENLIKQVLKNV